MHRLHSLSSTLVRSSVFKPNINCYKNSTYQQTSILNTNTQKLNYSDKSTENNDVKDEKTLDQDSTAAKLYNVRKGRDVKFETPCT